MRVFFYCFQSVHLGQRMRVELYVLVLVLCTISFVAKIEYIYIPSNNIVRIIM